MVVFTSDVNKLVKDAIAKYEEETKGIKFGEPNMQIYFDNFINRINLVLNSTLNADTFYKHYYIKLKTHSSPEIGYSIGYLNNLSNYTYNVNYLDKFPRVLWDDQEIPEFPFNHPAFPATPTIRIKYKDYANLWIKDESYNPTGSHKDRKAHELYLFYKNKIKEQSEAGGEINIPRLSLISAGNAALAIQYRFKKSGLPNLKVLVDENIDSNIYDTLKASGAEVFKTNLTEKKLSSKEILELTENDEENAIDLTYGHEIDTIIDSFYDWLSYECLNLNPEYLIVPYGTGDLFRNILEVHARELQSKANSKRYFGNRSILRECNFIGVRSQDKLYDTKLTFLMSYYNAVEESEAFPSSKTSYCGADSRIEYIQENNELFDDALKIMGENNISTKCLSGLAGFIYLLQREKSDKPIDKNKKIVIINTGGDLKKELFMRKISQKL